MYQSCRLLFFLVSPTSALFRVAHLILLYRFILQPRCHHCYFGVHGCHSRVAVTWWPGRRRSSEYPGWIAIRKSSPFAQILLSSFPTELLNLHRDVFGCRGSPLLIFISPLRGYGARAARLLLCLPPHVGCERRPAGFCRAHHSHRLNNETRSGRPWTQIWLQNPERSRKQTRRRKAGPFERRSQSAALASSSSFQWRDY